MENLTTDFPAELSPQPMSGVSGVTDPQVAHTAPGSLPGVHLQLPDPPMTIGDPPPDVKTALAPPHPSWPAPTVVNAMDVPDLSQPGQPRDDLGRWDEK